MDKVIGTACSLSCPLFPFPVLFYNGHEADLDCAAEPQKIRDFDEHGKSNCDAVKNELFLINGHEADLNCVTAPQRIKDSDKPWAQSAAKTVLISGDFHIKPATTSSIFIPLEPFTSIHAG